MSCLGRAAVPVKRVWRGLGARLGLRRATGKPSSYYMPVRRGPTQGRPGAEADAGVDMLDAGLGRLRKEVRTCEYSDVHVMWEMLSSTGTGAGRGAIAGKASRRGRKPASWSRLLSYCCAL